MRNDRMEGESINLMARISGLLVLRQLDLEGTSAKEDDMARERNDSGRRDRAVGAIAPLSELTELTVAEGDLDPRGWEVLASDQRRIGEVHELLVDTVSMHVRYLDVELDKDFREKDRERHILVPIACAWLDEDRDRVIVGSLASTAVAGVPEFTHIALTRDYELSLHDCFLPSSAPTAGTDGENDAFYGP